MLRPAFLAIALAFVAMLVFGAGAVAALQTGEADVPPLKRELGFMFRENGVWLAANLDFDGEPQSVETFSYRPQWGPGYGYGDIEIGGQFGDGTTRVFWRVTAVWDAEAGLVRLFQVSGFGTHATGYETRLDADTTEALLRFVSATGQVTEIRDTHRALGVDRMQSVSERRDGEAWQPMQTLDWVWTPDVAP